MRSPKVFPIRIIAPVVKVLSTILVAVPALNRVLPINTSGPVSTSIAKSASYAIRLDLQQEIAPVKAPFRLASAKPPKTYGVRPDAAIPTTQSLSSKPMLYRSLDARSVESSAPSTARNIAPIPPAISPVI